MGRSAHIVVVQDKFAQILIEAARTFKNCLAKTLRNRSRVGIERGLAVAAVARPEAGADAFVRIGLGLDGVRPRTRRRSAAVKTGHGESHGTPEKVDRADLAVKICGEPLPEGNRAA